MKDLAILILNWNNKKLTDSCINSIGLQTYKNFKIFVIDNGSSDGSAEFLKKRHEDVEIIQNRSNLGYAAGNNAGLKIALKKGFKYIFVLNNDTQLMPNTLKLLIKLLKSHRKIGVVAPLALTYYDDKINLKICRLYGSYDFIKGELIPAKIDITKPTRVDLALGCALLFKSDVLKKVGLFDERYFVYWEENDLLLRVGKAGYFVYVHSQAKIYHRGGSTTRFSTFPISYYTLRNQLYFHEKNSSKFKFMAFIIYFVIKLPFFLFRRKNFRELRLNLLAIKDYLMGRYFQTSVLRSSQGFFR